ncbi:MAG TPA: hypothetical protein VD903_00060, partial [Pseudonocardia sp.]|nr:hypothetical protein [Pseudonocardia sp.]
GLPPRTAPSPSWRGVVPGGVPGGVPGDVREPAGRVPAVGGDQDRALPPGGSRATPEPPGRATAVGDRPGAGVAEPAARGPAPRPSATGHLGGMYPPPLATGAAAAGQGQEHRRPDYLLDDTDAFADDRWFPPAVITPDHVPPIRS